MGAQIQANNPWDQLEGEPDAAYARFLLYRGLGRGRSIDAAYLAVASEAPKSAKKRRAPGSWDADSRTWMWESRANAWDIHQFQQNGIDVVLDFIGGIRAAVRQVKRTLETEQIETKTWSKAFDALTRLGSFVPANTVAALRDNARDDRAPAVGATSASVATDYRSLLASVAPRPNDDSDAPSQDQSHHDGAAVGQVYDGGSDNDA